MEWEEGGGGKRENACGSVREIEIDRDGGERWIDSERERNREIERDR